MHLHHPFIRVLRSTERRVRRPVEAEVRGPLLARRRGLAGQLPAQRRDERALPDLRSLDPANLTGLVLGCIEANFCKKICV